MATSRWRIVVGISLNSSLIFKLRQIITTAFRRLWQKDFARRYVQDYRRFRIVRKVSEGFARSLELRS